MSEKQNRGIGDLSKYDAMTTEELEEILRLDAQAPEEQESDTETILYIMEVLTERKRNNVHTGKTALEAYESFKKNYMPEVDHTEIAQKGKRKTRTKSLRWLRALTATAAVLVILILGSVTAKAFGVDIWEAVVKWTQETFHFVGDSTHLDDPNKSADLNHTSLQEVLISAGIQESLVPSWVLEGYQLVDVRVEQTPLQDRYNAIYKNENQVLKITVRHYLNADPLYIEQSDDLVEIYEVSGTKYYIFSNHDQTQAAWIKDSFECRILGELTIEELKLMIDSIEEG